MNPLLLTANPKTPEIQFKPDGLLFIGGRSIPENSLEFYQPMFLWLEEYAHAPAPQTVFRVQLEYFNTSSSKCLLDIFRRLEAIQASGKSKVNVEWKYEEEDEDMMEAGDDYKSIVNLPFSLEKG